MRRAEGEPLPEPPDTSAELGWASEEGALERWQEFLDDAIDDYDTARDRAG